VKDTRGLVKQVGNAEVGKAVRVVVYRDGGTQTVLVTLGRREDAERSEQPVAQTETPDVTEKEVLGLKLALLTDELRQELSVPADQNGLVVMAVDETSQAWEKGLRAGDVITEAGQQKVTTLDGFEERITEAKDAGRKSLLLLVRRAGEPRFVALSLEN